MEFWNSDEASELDLLSEAEEVEEIAQQLAEQPEIVEASQEQIEEVIEESAYDLTDQQANTIFNAKLRLEQAKLYEMLINHNLFEGVDASPEAIERVQAELKLYIVHRLEVLLGLRKPVIKKESPELPLNHVELDFLKQLAYKGTRGASIQQEREEDLHQPTQPAPRPVQTKAKAPGLNPIGRRPTATRPVQKQTLESKPVQKQSVKQAPPQSSQPTRKPKKNAQEDVHKLIRSDGVLGQRNLTQAEAMEIAKADMSKSEKKPFHKMTAKEKAARIKEVNERYAKKPRPEGALPIPTADQLAAQYTTQQSLRSGSDNQMTQFKELLASALVQGNILTKESK